MQWWPCGKFVAAQNNAMTTSLPLAKACEASKCGVHTKDVPNVPRKGPIPQPASSCLLSCRSYGWSGLHLNSWLLTCPGLPNTNNVSQIPTVSRVVLSECSWGQGSWQWRCPSACGCWPDPDSIKYFRLSPSLKYFMLDLSPIPERQVER